MVILDSDKSAGSLQRRLGKSRERGWPPLKLKHRTNVLETTRNAVRLRKPLENPYDVIRSGVGISS